jgi:hypothetical protein
MFQEYIHNNLVMKMEKNQMFYKHSIKMSGKDTCTRILTSVWKLRVSSVALLECEWDL